MMGIPVLSVWREYVLWQQRVSFSFIHLTSESCFPFVAYFGLLIEMIFLPTILYFLIGQVLLASHLFDVAEKNFFLKKYFEMLNFGGWSNF